MTSMGSLSAWGNFLLGVAASVVAAVLVWLWRNHIYPQIRRSLASNQYSITGRWEMRDWLYDYDEEGSYEELVRQSQESTYSDNAILNQNASGVVSGSFENSVSRYNLSGVVEGLAFTGSWEEISEKRKTTWHGTFQFKITPHRDGATMTGRWTGTSADGENIHCGEWEWRERIDPSEQSKRSWPSEEFRRPIVQIARAGEENQSLLSERDGLSANQARLLGILVDACSGGAEMNQRRIESLWGVEAASAELYYRLEVLRLQHFIQKRRVSADGQFSYKLTERFECELADA